MSKKFVVSSSDESDSNDEYVPSDSYESETYDSESSSDESYENNDDIDNDDDVDENYENYSEKDEDYDPKEYTLDIEIQYDNDNNTYITMIVEGNCTVESILEEIFDEFHENLEHMLKVIVIKCDPEEIKFLKGGHVEFDLTSGEYEELKENFLET